LSFDWQFGEGSHVSNLLNPFREPWLFAAGHLSASACLIRNKIISIRRPDGEDQHGRQLNSRRLHERRIGFLEYQRIDNLSETITTAARYRPVHITQILTRKASTTRFPIAREQRSLSTDFGPPLLPGTARIQNISSALIGTHRSSTIRASLYLGTQSRDYQLNGLSSERSSYIEYFSMATGLGRSTLLPARYVPGYRPVNSLNQVFERLVIEKHTAELRFNVP